MTAVLARVTCGELEEDWLRGTLVSELFLNGSVLGKERGGVAGWPDKLVVWKGGSTTRAACAMAHGSLTWQN